MLLKSVGPSPSAPASEFRTSEYGTRAPVEVGGDRLAGNAVSPRSAISVSQGRAGVVLIGFRGWFWAGEQAAVTRCPRSESTAALEEGRLSNSARIIREPVSAST